MDNPGLNRYQYPKKDNPIKSRLRNPYYFFRSFFTFGHKNVDILGVKAKFKNVVFMKLNLNESVKEIQGYVKNYKIKPGDVVLDLGAYQGTFSVYASKIVGKSGLVIAIEPDKANFMVLKRNLKLNNCKNVLALNVGIWNFFGMLNFKRIGPASLFGEGEDKLQVIRLNLFNNIDFIKVDIEGAEVEILEDCLQLSKQGTKFAIASYHLNKGVQTSKTIEKFFKTHGVDVKTEYPLHLTTYV